MANCFFWRRRYRRTISPSRPATSIFAKSSSREIIRCTYGYFALYAEMAFSCFSKVAASSLSSISS